MFWTICCIIILVSFAIISLLNAIVHYWDISKKRLVSSIILLLIPTASLIIYFVNHLEWILWLSLILWIISSFILLRTTSKERSTNCPYFDYGCGKCSVSYNWDSCFFDYQYPLFKDCRIYLSNSGDWINAISGRKARI